MRSRSIAPHRLWLGAPWRTAATRFSFLRMTERTALLYGALLIAASLAYTAWRIRVARTIAEEWLARHRYRVRSLRHPWFALPRFAPRLFRNEHKAFQFRAEVDDLRLGGTGTLWLRVWTDWLGVVGREPEIRWDRMPVRLDDRSDSPELRWAELQLELMRRIERGETTFRSPAREGSGDFELLAETILALARRGFVTCDAPVMSRDGAHMAAVTGVQLTTAGRAALARERDRASGAPTGASGPDLAGLP